MKTSKFNHRKNPAYVTNCAICESSFTCYRRGKKTCSQRCRRQLRSQTRQEAATKELTAELVGLYQIYRLEQDTKANKIIY